MLQLHRWASTWDAGGLVDRRNPGHVSSSSGNSWAAESLQPLIKASR